MNRFLTLVLLLVSALTYAAGSSINPSVPATNAALQSAPVRANFAAAYSDINAIIQQNGSITAPASPLLGQLWLNITSTPYVLNEWDGSQWVEILSINSSAHVVNLNVGAISATTFAGTGSETLTFANGSGINGITLNGGTSSGDYAIISLQNGGVTRGRLVANESINDLRIDTGGSVGTITFYYGASYTLAMQIGTNGIISTARHFSPSTSNTPTISSGACGATTNGTISGTDQAGLITIGSATTSACAVTFGSSTWASGPNSCVITPSTSSSASALAYVSALSASGFTVSGTVLASTSFYYNCQ